MRFRFLLLALTCITTIPAFTSTASADVLRRKEVQQLSSIPATPFIPSYTGRNPLFEQAFRTVHLKDGLVSLEIQIEAKEDPSQVLSWYKTVMQQNQWTIEDFNSPDSVTGTKLGQGNQCTVHISQAMVDGYRTRIVISYQTFKPTPPDQDDSDKSQIAAPSAQTIPH